MELVKSIGNFDGVRSMRARKDVFSRHYQFDRLVRQMLNAEEGPLPHVLVPELFAHWGDPASRIGESYIRSCLAHAEECNGHILQCGPGLMTLVLGILCTRQASDKKRVWCLADDAHWANVMRSWLTQYGITHTHVVVSRPQMFDGFVWYSVDPEQFPEEFALTLSNGGHSAVSGVTGLTERMSQHLRKDCVVLARQVLSGTDQQRLQSWAKSHDLSCVLVDKQEGFLKVTKVQKAVDKDHGR